MAGPGAGSPHAFSCNSLRQLRTVGARLVLFVFRLARRHDDREDVYFSIRHSRIPWEPFFFSQLTIFRFAVYLYET